MEEIDRYVANVLPPFTSFGWQGPNRMDPRVFEQDTFWVDARGQGHRLAEMDVDYLRNVMNFIFRNASSYHYQYAAFKVEEATEAAAKGEVHGEVLATAIGQSASHLTTPEWLMSTPLFRKIEQLLDQAN